MKRSLERVKDLMGEIQDRVGQIEVSYGQMQFDESLKAHNEAVKLKRMFAVERASIGLALHGNTVAESNNEFEALIQRVNNSLKTLRKYTREFASSGIMEASHA